MVNGIGPTVRSRRIDRVTPGATGVRSHVRHMKGGLFSDDAWSR